jgi:hypothetical protein
MVVSLVGLGTKNHYAGEDQSVNATNIASTQKDRPPALVEEAPLLKRTCL